jgi:hypothetical protein
MTAISTKYQHMDVNIHVTPAFTPGFFIFIAIPSTKKTYAFDKKDARKNVCFQHEKEVYPLMETYTTDCSHSIPATLATPAN